MTDNEFIEKQSEILFNHGLANFFQFRYLIEDKGLLDEFESKYFDTDSKEEQLAIFESYIKMV
jgi:hypothetical protein